MADIVTYDLADSIATITMDDGKVNVIGPAMQRELNAALDQAVADGAVVVLGGRGTIFSAGFDLKVLQGGGTAAADMLRGGFELAERLLSFPRPVIISCPGHAIAMGVFLLASGDYCVGVSGPFRIVANEVAIGLMMPRAATEILRNRLTPAAFNRAITLAEMFAPDGAVAAGFLDRVVDRTDLESTVREVAAASVVLDARAHAASKLRARASALAAIRAGIEADDAEIRKLF